VSGLGAARANAEACPNAQFRSGPSERLPDCRAYELVSPVDKNGQDAITLVSLFPAQASACQAGEACLIAYMSTAAFGAAQGGNLPNAYLSTREASAWQTTALTPPTLQAPANGKAKVSYAFSPDLSRMVVRVAGQQLAEGAPAGVYNLFLRDAAGSYSLVTSIAPPTPPRAGCGSCFEFEDVPTFAGASSGFGRILFEANDSLVEGAPGNGVENLYEAVEGRVRLVGYLPDGQIAAQGANAGGGINAVTEQHAGELEHAISQDGSHVLFEAAADGGGPDAEQAGETQLYDRVDGVSTVEVSAPAEGAQPQACETRAGQCDPGAAEFWAASADGSIVYFTSKAALTRESFTGPEESLEARRQREEETGEAIENPGNDLYRYEVGTGALTDLTAGANQEADPNGASVLGVVGASEDGSYVYFVAEGRLAPGAPSEQESPAANLYVWHAGQTRFIAALAPPTPSEQSNIEAMRTGPAFVYRSDVADWTSRPTMSQAYVTPDGRHLAFMSVKPLTGYDNRQASVAGPEGEELDHEVFEYSAETGALVCASCDPSGAQPIGSAYLGAKLNERVSTPFHQPRSLSDDGARLFFTSPDTLVTGLSGGSEKVFEYKDGRVQLISGAESGGNDVFLDASASGNDVFFATREQLVAGDADELVDVYDARVGGGLPQPTLGAAPCLGSACASTLDQAPVLTTPLSATFAGLGNLAPHRQAAKPTHRQLLARALARCRKLKDDRRRSACVKAARRRYAGHRTSRPRSRASQSNAARP